ncbi:MAG: hypothetical protein HY757_09180 [Nitrospirae bacterium]|nr:hypothetical protein [Nitrospirota bacterium]
MIISGDYYGGYASTPGYITPPVVNKTVSNQVTSSYTPVNIIRNMTNVTTHTSLDPVDMAGGAFLYTNSANSDRGHNSDRGQTYNIHFRVSRVSGVSPETSQISGCEK